MSLGWSTKIEAALAQIREASSSLTVGCPDSELAEFQLKLGIQLPQAYLAFLRGVGVECGAFMAGSDLTLRVLPRLQVSARALLDDDGAPELPVNGFVFCGHQGYQFLFFRLSDDTEDPKVEHYMEGEKRFQVVASTFSDWLTQAVQDEFAASEP